MASYSKLIQDIVFECITKDISLNFPDFLKNVRMKIGLSKLSLSNFLNIASPTYSDFEDPTYFVKPNQKQLKKIADFYDINFDLLKKKCDEFRELS